MGIILKIFLVVLVVGYPLCFIEYFFHKKLRIVKITDSRRKHPFYIIERKFFFWWIDATGDDCMEYDTLEKAKEDLYLYQKAKHKKEIIYKDQAK